MVLCIANNVHFKGIYQIAKCCFAVRMLAVCLFNRTKILAYIGTSTVMISEGISALISIEEQNDYHIDVQWCYIRY